MTFNQEKFDWNDTTRFVPVIVGVKKTKRKKRKRVVRKKKEEIFAKRPYVKRNLDWKRDGKKYHKQYNDEHYKTTVQKKELTKLTNELFSEHDE